MHSRDEWIANELIKARKHLASGNADSAFHHLERVHVVGQNSTRHHVRAHVEMLRWAWINRRFGEMSGQVFRIFGALTKTAIGMVPQGNTGGSNVSPFRSMPISDDLQHKIEQLNTD